MNSGYSSRVTLRAKLLAELVFLLIKEKTLNYEEIRETTGLSRTKLEYLVKHWDTEPTPLKIDAFIKLLAWFEESSFPKPDFSESQKIVCERIQATFQKEDSDRVYGAFTKGFQLSTSKLAHLCAELEGYYLVFRFRGTSNRVMVGAITMHPDQESNYFTWSLKFKEGDRPWDDEKPLKEWEMRTRIVRGYAAPHENVLTCLGRRDGSNEIHMLNLMLSDAPEKQDEFTGVFSSHSRSEAISRGLLLVRQRGVNVSNSYELNDVIKDYKIENLDRITKNRNANFTLPRDIREFRYGLSVDEGQTKFFLPERFTFLDQSIETTEND